jgi:hypothetical protein
VAFQSSYFSSWIWFLSNRDLEKRLDYEMVEGDGGTHVVAHRLLLAFTDGLLDILSQRFEDGNITGDGLCALALTVCCCHVAGLVRLRCAD